MNDLVVAWIIYGCLLGYFWFEALWTYYKLRQQPYWRPLMLETVGKILKMRINTRQWFKLELGAAIFVSLHFWWFPAWLARWMSR